jgi:hypothetical protein
MITATAVAFTVASRTPLKSSTGGVRVRTLATSQRLGAVIDPVLFGARVGCIASVGHEVRAALDQRARAWNPFLVPPGIRPGQIQ